MKICVAGKNNIAVNISEFIRQYYPEIDLCYIPNRTDKGYNEFQRSMIWYATQNGIPKVDLNDVYDVDDLLFLSIEFDRLVIPNKFRSKRLFNIHFSELPKYKGMYTSAIPLLRGEKKSGVTFHYIDPGIDTGDIIDQHSFNLEASETAQSLYLKYIKHGSAIVIKNIPSLIRKSEQGYPQPIEGSSYFSKKSVNYSDLQLDLNQTAWNIDCQIRAYHFRSYQLPKLEGEAVINTIPTGDKSMEKPGAVLENTEFYIKIATIDFDTYIYKDKLNELIKAASSGDLDFIKRVPDIKQYRNEKEVDHGWTLLMVAAYHNQYAIVKYLVESGFDVNAQNNNGTTVIMYAKDAALKTGSTDVLTYLILSGANPLQCDYYGKNLYDYLDNQDIELANMIRRFECK